MIRGGRDFPGPPILTNLTFLTANQSEYSLQKNTKNRQNRLQNAYFIASGLAANNPAF